jgi:5-methyltetrahydrofolate--homocysteine methyltransferase
MSEQLVQLIADMEEEQAVALIKQMLDQGADPAAVLDDCRAAMSVVGQRFEAGEYFIPELILAGEILKSISAEVKPRIQHSPDAPQGARVLLGTVKGDIHDIGKDIVNFMLDVNGFQVTDLGVDVPIEKFVEQIKELHPPVVALSGFLTLAYTSMKETVDAIEAAGLRDKVKIMVGGAPVDAEFAKRIGADGYGSNAPAGADLAKKFAGAA